MQNIKVPDADVDSLSDHSEIDSNQADEPFGLDLEYRSYYHLCEYNEAFLVESDQESQSTHSSAYGTPRLNPEMTKQCGPGCVGDLTSSVLDHLDVRVILDDLLTSVANHLEIKGFLDEVLSSVFDYLEIKEILDEMVDHIENVPDLAEIDTAIKEPADKEDDVVTGLEKHDASGDATMETPGQNDSLINKMRTKIDELYESTQKVIPNLLRRSFSDTLQNSASPRLHSRGPKRCQSEKYERADSNIPGADCLGLSDTELFQDCLRTSTPVRDLNEPNVERCQMVPLNFSLQDDRPPTPAVMDRNPHLTHLQGNYSPVMSPTVSDTLSEMGGSIYFTPNAEPTKTKGPSGRFKKTVSSLSHKAQRYNEYLRQATGIGSRPAKFNLSADSYFTRNIENGHSSASGSQISILSGSQLSMVSECIEESMELPEMTGDEIETYSQVSVMSDPELLGSKCPLEDVSVLLDSQIENSVADDSREVNNSPPENDFAPRAKNLRGLPNTPLLTKNLTLMQKSFGAPVLKNNITGTPRYCRTRLSYTAQFKMKQQFKAEEAERERKLKKSPSKSKVIQCPQNQQPSKRSPISAKWTVDEGKTNSQNFIKYSNSSNSNNKSAIEMNKPQRTPGVLTSMGYLKIGKSDVVHEKLEKK